MKAELLAMGPAEVHKYCGEGRSCSRGGGGCQAETMGIRAGTVTQLVQCLPSMQEALGNLVSSITWEQSDFQEVAAGGSEVQGYPRLHTEFKTSLGYVRPYFKR